MTCIVGLVDKNCVYIGADSCASDGWTARESKLSKVFIRGKFLIGYTSSFRLGNLLQYRLEVESQKDGMTDEEYMVVSFTESVRKLFKEGGFAKVENNVETGGQFLVGYNGTLYDLDSDFQLNNLGEVNAIGLGRLVALGSMYSTKNKKPTERIRIALGVASELCGAVIPPFKILKLISK